MNEKLNENEEMRFDESKMIKMKEDDENEDCPICMAPINFESVTAQYWYCCGSRICCGCIENMEKTNNNKEPIIANTQRERIVICPFCRSPEIQETDPVAHSQILMFAVKGKAWAMLLLAWRYCNGFCVKKDIKKAIHYYTLAADGGNHKSQNYLASLYADGGLITQDFKKAFHYYKLAAEGGSIDAYYNIGLCYENGWHVKQSHEMAVKYYKVSGDKGDKYAQFCLGRNYYNGIGVKSDITLALKYYTLSADQGYEKAVTYLPLLLSSYIKKGEILSNYK